LRPDQDTTAHVDHGSRLGVGILLSPAGVSAFKMRGAVKHVGYSSGWVMAVCLLFRDLSGEDLGVHFVCAHAPTGTQPPKQSGICSSVTSVHAQTKDVQAMCWW
jgi:hypothetical protein